MGKGPGRNDPCPCHSGKKYKHCCLGNKGTAAPKKAHGHTPRPKPRRRASTHNAPAAGQKELFAAYRKISGAAVGVRAGGVPLIAGAMMEFMTRHQGGGSLVGRQLFVVDLLMMASAPLGPRHEEFLTKVRSNLDGAALRLLDLWRAAPLLAWRVHKDRSGTACFGPDTEPVPFVGGWGDGAELVAGWRIDWGGLPFLLGTVPIDEAQLDGATDAWGNIVSLGRGTTWRYFFAVEDALVVGMFGARHNDSWGGGNLFLGSHYQLEGMVDDVVELASRADSPLGDEQDDFRQLVERATKERGAESVDRLLARCGLTRDGRWAFGVPSPAAFPVSVLGLPSATLQALGVAPRAPLTQLEARCDGSASGIEALRALDAWHGRNRWLAWRDRRPTGFVAYHEVRRAIDLLLPSLGELECAALPVPAGAWKRLVRGWHQAGMPVPTTIAQLPPDQIDLRLLKGVGDVSIDELAQALLEVFRQAHGAGATVGSAAEVDAAREQIDDGLTELAGLFEK